LGRSARELRPDGRHLSGDALRQRRRRARERAGVAVLDVPVAYFDLVEALLVSERLSEPDALDRKRVEAAAAEVLADWVARWRHA
jgi:hypothetical protein